MPLPEKTIKFTEEQKQKGFPEPSRIPIMDKTSKEYGWRLASDEEIKDAITHRDEIIRLHNCGAKISEDQALLLYAIQLEEAARASGNANDLVEALIRQGRFEEALYFAMTAAKIEECRKLVIARDRPDDERCDCPDKQIEGQVIPSEMVLRKIYVQKRNAYCYLTMCVDCQEMNISQEPPAPIINAHNKRLERGAVERQKFLQNMKRG